MEEKLTAQEYFDKVKNAKVEIDDDMLLQTFENAKFLLDKAMVTGQISQADKLVFHLESITKERKLVKMGINTFVYKEDIEDFIDNVAKNTVKIIELERYEREIPDDIVDVIVKTKDIFDAFYIVFTDYTGVVERQVLKERKEKDPILFGTFEDEKNKVLINRFYFLGDWEDEYCDLTLDKMVCEMKSERNKEIERRISTPVSIEDIKKQLETLRKKDDGFRMVRNIDKEKKKSGFDKIRSFFKKK